MNHDAVLHLDIYSDDSGIHRGELLYALHEVVHATSGENTLAMVYVRNKAERAAAGWQKDTFRLLDRLCGNDLQARITFIPNGASPRWGQHVPGVLALQAKQGMHVPFKSRKVDVSCS